MWGAFPTGVDRTARISGRSGTRTSKATVSAAAQMIARGEWVYGTASYDSAHANVAGTDELMGSVTAGTSDMLLPYIRFRLAQWNDSDAVKVPAWVAVVKYDSAGALPEIDDSTAMEQLKSEGRLFHRELIVYPGQHNPMKWVNLEFRNVRLLASERLGIIINPFVTDTVKSLRIIDYRKVEV